MAPASGSGWRAWNWGRLLRRSVGYPALAFLPAGAYVAYAYRPRSSRDVDYHEKLRGNDRAPTNTAEATLYYLASTFTLALVTTAFKTYMASCHELETLDHDKFLRHVTHGRGGVPLLTVANHISTLDDPLLMSCILPTSVNLAPHRMRWGICTEEICFSNPAVGAFFGMGRALPIQRGGSIHQKGMATLQRKLNEGEWVHVFPEGRVWQEGGTPLRDPWGRWCSASGRCGDPWRKVGPPKWGVGKLVANATVTPLIVPWFHAGMSDVMPQNAQNETLSPLPTTKPARLVTVKVRG